MINKGSSIFNSRPDTGKTNVLKRRSILQSNANISIIDGGVNIDTKSSFVPKVSILKEINPALNDFHASGPPGSTDARERKVDYKLHDKIRTVSQNSYYKNMHNMTTKFDKNLHLSNNLDNLNRKV